MYAFNFSLVCYLQRNNFIYSLAASYFPVKLIKTCEIDPNDSYLFCGHPHGIFCFGGTISFASDALG